MEEDDFSLPFSSVLLGKESFPLDLVLFISLPFFLCLDPCSHGLRRTLLWVIILRLRPLLPRKVTA